MAIRVLISEDYAPLRADLCMLLRAAADIEVVGEANTLAELCRLARQLLPDIVLLDIDLPDLHSLRAISELRRAVPNTHVLVVINSEDISLIRDALAAGAAGCVISQVADTTLVPAIRIATGGQLYIRPSLLRALLTDVRLQAAIANRCGEQLTPLEVQVLWLIARGYTNRQLANTLGMSMRTVMYHRAKMMVKLGLHSRLQLVQYALARRLDAAPRASTASDRPLRDP